MITENRTKSKLAAVTKLCPGWRRWLPCERDIYGLPVAGLSAFRATSELGADLARTWGDHALVLLQGHGVASAAATPAEAALPGNSPRALAEANWRVLAMGRQPRVIPADELQQRAATGVGWQVRWAYYRQLAGCE